MQAESFAMSSKRESGKLEHIYQPFPYLVLFIPASDSYDGGLSSYGGGAEGSDVLLVVG